jgi:hypothetical protein
MSSSENVNPQEETATMSNMTNEKQTYTTRNVNYYIVFNEDWDSVSCNGVVKSFQKGAEYHILKAAIGVSKVSGKIGFNYFYDLPLHGVQSAFCNVPVQYVSIKEVVTVKVTTVETTNEERFI